MSTKSFVLISARKADSYEQAQYREICAGLRSPPALTAARRKRLAALAGQPDSQIDRIRGVDQTTRLVPERAHSVLEELDNAGQGELSVVSTPPQGVPCGGSSSFTE